MSTREFVRASTTKNDGILHYDADENGAGEAVAFAKISKNLALSFQDIVVI